MSRSVPEDIREKWNDPNLRSAFDAVMKNAINSTGDTQMGAVSTLFECFVAFSIRDADFRKSIDDTQLDRDLVQAMVDSLREGNNG